MQRMEERYPGWEFAAHVGYSTPEHRAAIAKLGVSPLHRMSFQSMAYQQLALCNRWPRSCSSTARGTAAGAGARSLAELRAAGHDVLGSHARRAGRARAARPLRPTSTLHVDELAGLLYFADLREVVLVGHSYGGMVITGAAAALAAPASRGWSTSTRSSPTTASRCSTCCVPSAARSTSESAVDGLIPSPPPELFGVTDRGGWLGDRLTDQPLRTFTEPLALAVRAAAAAQYIRCTQGPLTAELLRLRHAPARHRRLGRRRLRLRPRRDDHPPVRPRRAAGHRRGRIAHEVFALKLQSAW